MRRIVFILVASASLCAPALAEEVGVGVGVGPVGAGVTVGSGPDRVVKESDHREGASANGGREEDYREGTRLVGFVLASKRAPAFFIGAFLLATKPHQGRSRQRKGI